MILRQVLQKHQTPTPEAQTTEVNLSDTVGGAALVGYESDGELDVSFEIYNFMKFKKCLLLT